MANWPNIAEPKFPIKESYYSPTYRSNKEAPYIQVRKRWTKGLCLWTLEWDDEVSLLEADYQTLKTFFDANQAMKFNWTHPGSRVVHSVIFDQDALEGQIIVPGYRTLAIQLREQ